MSGVKPAIDRQQGSLRRQITVVLATPLVDWLDVAILAPVVGWLESALVGAPVWFFLVCL